MRISLLVLAVIAVAGCSDSTGPGDQRGLLEQNLALWSRKGPGSYRFTITRSCECIPEMTGPVVIEVVNGQVDDRRYATGGAVSPQYDDLFRPIPGLFELIGLALDSPAAAVSVRYDAVYGYPASIQIDWVAGVADDEVSYRVDDFAPLPDS